MNSQQRIAYIVEICYNAAVGFPTPTINIYPDRSRAMIVYSMFLCDNFTCSLRKRILLDNEIVINNSRSSDKIIREIEWNKRIHSSSFSKNIEFSKIIRTLSTLSLVRDSILYCLPRDILYYLFSFLEGGITELDATKIDVTKN